MGEKGSKKLDEFFNPSKPEKGIRSIDEFSPQEIVERISRQLEGGINMIIGKNDSPELREAMLNFANAFEGTCFKGEGGRGDLPQTQYQLEKFINFLEKAIKELK